MKTTVIAAVDNSAAAGPVIEMARSVATLFGADVEAVHVREDGIATVKGLADAAHTSLRLLAGSPADVLVDALRESGVILGVLGIRREMAGRPIGHIALNVVQRAQKPVIAVPPIFPSPSGRGSGWGPLHRVLVPLDGSARTARSVETMVRQLAERGLEVLALHVFDAARVPRFSDQPQHEVVVWEREFLARYYPPGTQLHTRRGWAAPAVLEVATTEHADLIVLGWAQDLSAGRAAVIREVLARSTVPVLLLPLVAHLTATHSLANSRRNHG